MRKLSLALALTLSTIAHAGFSDDQEIPVNTPAADVYNGQLRQIREYFHNACANTTDLACQDGVRGTWRYYLNITGGAYFGVLADEASVRAAREVVFASWSQSTW